VPAVPRDAHGAHAGATLTLRSTDIAGAKIPGAADEPWGEMLVFADPDGIVLKLMKPKP
jgi:hypothetical protein